MNLLLDHTQRLNLHALMGAQRGTVDDLRLFWKLQDRINLSDEEKASIHFRVEQLNGGAQQAHWDTAAPFKPQQYEFSDEEFARVSKMVREWAFVGTDRQWLEPLMAQFDNKNGSQ